MASLIELKTFSDQRGSLSVIEKELPFNVKRVFYIYDVNDEKRGGHRHIKTKQAVICISGECKIFNDNSVDKKIFFLDHPSKCLILEPDDWHTMYDFTHGAVLLVLASEYFDPFDYIYTPY